jgi:peptidoglycan endopeptidase LytE
MSFFRFPYALAVCSAITMLFAASASAQTEMRPRTITPQTSATTTSEVDGRSRLENDVMLVSEAEEPEPDAITVAPLAPRSLGQFEQTMLAAIDARIGVPYRMGSEGPTRYDCSGFVWSVFQTAGVSFERSSARSFWHQFAPVDGAERYKFGTLVFFNGLAHVGIVADEHGFYHASTSRGVTYSPFNEYWTKRITGFRRVRLQPLAPTQIAAGR